jgi:hypothetical protein
MSEKNSMKTLIAISTHRAFEADGSNDASRETWLRDALPPGFDYKFFCGRGDIPLKPDTVALDCGDTYDQMTWKTLGKLKYAVDHGYDFIFLACADTYVRPERLAACCFEAYDCFGTFVSIASSGKFICGGSGYFLSALAAKVILASPKPIGKQAETYEDMYVTSRLRYMPEFRIGDDSALFASQGTGPREWNQVVTKHLHWRVCNELVYTSGLMREEHRTWEDSVIAARTLVTPQRKSRWWSRNTQVAT